MTFKRNKGAIPDFMLKEMIKKGVVNGVKEKLVNPASINLPISEEVWRIERFYLPRKGEKISDLIKHNFGGRPHSYSHPLERSVQYLIKLKADFRLPNSVYGFCNPRSTTGRTFLKVHVVADGVSRFDSIPAGFQGELWLLVRNDIFSSLLMEDDELVQARLFYSDTRLNQQEIKDFYRRRPLLFRPNGKPLPYEELAITDNDGSVVMTLAIATGRQAGWKTKPTGKPVKFSKENKTEDFFEPLFSKDGTLELDLRTGFILPTKEVVIVSNDMAAECVRVDDRAGEYNSHRAGYIDSGFQGVITLEITGGCETIRDGTSALKLKFERTAAPAANPYKSNYSGRSIAVLGRNFV